MLKFTQIVATEGTLEKKLKFFGTIDCNKSQLVEAESDMDIHDNGMMTRKLLITNVSDTPQKICVLVEYENSSEDRNTRLNNLSNDASLNLFKKYNFQIIEPNSGCHEFIKPYCDRIFVTMFLIGDSDVSNKTGSNTEDGFNIESYDRFETKKDYLYFDNDLLNSFVALRLKCSLDDKHYLARSRTSHSTNNGNCKDCGIIAISH